MQRNEHDCLLTERGSKCSVPQYTKILPIGEYGVKKENDEILPSVVQECVPLASNKSTFFNAIIAFLGSGVLGFPYAFKETGILLGLVLLTLVAVMTGFCMLLLIECKYRIQSKYHRTITKYGEIGSIVMGTKGEGLVNFSLVISQAGFCVGYLIFISTNVHAYLGIPKPMVVAYCVPCIIGFCLLKHLKQLSYVALMADIMNFSGLALVYLVDFTFIDWNSSTDATSSLRVWGVWSSIPFFLGVSTYAFAGVGMALPLENAMQHKKEFKRILIFTILLIELVYASFGICGYLAFQNETQDVVTLNIEGHGGIATTVKLCLCIGLLCACPLMLFPVFEVLHGPFFPKKQPSNIKNIFFRSIIIVLVASIAGGAPNFGSFISFIGSTCCSFLGFVLPVIFHYKLCADSSSLASKSVAALITLIGLLIVVFGFYTAVHQFIS